LYLTGRTPRSGVLRQRFRRNRERDGDVIPAKHPIVIPAKAGIHPSGDTESARTMDPGFRRGDERRWWGVVILAKAVANDRSRRAENLSPPARPDRIVTRPAPTE
jgi:hypothetical protein